MKKKLVNRVILMGATLITTVVLSLAQAHDYNDGLLAAETGDYHTAVMKWEPLAKQGDAKAQFNLALMYHRGLGVGINESKAVDWYIQSANNGYSKAQEFLAAAYQEGWFGLPRDRQKAEYWLKRLDEQSF